MVSLLTANGGLPDTSPSVSLAWDPSPDRSVIAYHVYYGMGRRRYTNMIPVGPATTAALSGLTEGVTYFIAVTAVNRLGLESDYSNEISYTVPVPRPGLQLASPPAGPAILRITGRMGRAYEVLATEDLRRWKVIGVVTLTQSEAVNFIDTNATDHSARFYRVREKATTPPRLGLFLLSNKQAVLRITGQRGRAYEVLATDDLKHWTVIALVTAAVSDVVNVIDSNAADHAARFYRVRELP